MYIIISYNAELAGCWLHDICTAVLKDHLPAGQAVWSSPRTPSEAYRRVTYLLLLRPYWGSVASTCVTLCMLPPSVMGYRRNELSPPRGGATGSSVLCPGLLPLPGPLPFNPYPRASAAHAAVLLSLEVAPSLVTAPRPLLGTVRSSPGVATAACELLHVPRVYDER